MFKKFLISIIVMLTSFTILNAEGFKDIKDVYYYKVPTTFFIEDWSPAISDDFYVGISYDGITYERISDTIAWGSIRPVIKTFTYTPDIIANNVSLGIFINPNNEWLVDPQQIVTVNFEQSSGTFTYIPSEIFNGGKYDLVTQFDVEKLPEYITLQYSVNNGINWESLDVIKCQNIITWTFLNTFINSDVIFRYIYTGTDVVIAQTEQIEVNIRDTYFKFKTYGGQKNYNDATSILWEKSPNFEKVKITIFLNDSLINETNYITDNLLLNFNDYGQYKVVGCAESYGFKIEQMIIFNVGDPCIDIKEENLKLNDSIIILNNDLEVIHNIILILNSESLQKDSIIANLNSIIIEKDVIIEVLKAYIKDSTTITQLIYKTDDITIVKDTKYGEVQYVTYNQGIITVPNNITGAFTIWIFDITGKLQKSEYFDNAPTELMVGDLISGTYYIYYFYNDAYFVAKFTVL